MNDIKQHLKIRAHLGIAVYLGKEDHVETAEAWVCAETSEDPWEEQRSRLKWDITGKWEQSERGGVFVRSFPVCFFFPRLPTSTCFHVPPICYKEKWKSIYWQPAHSAGKVVNQTAATSWTVKEKFRKTCNLCSDLKKTLSFPTTEVLTTLSSMNWKTFFMLFKFMEPQKAIL